MRGIGKGQTIKLLVTPEVAQLITTNVPHAAPRCAARHHQRAARRTEVRSLSPPTCRTPHRGAQLITTNVPHAAPRCAAHHLQRAARRTELRSSSVRRALLSSRLSKARGLAQHAAQQSTRLSKARGSAKHAA